MARQRRRNSTIKRKLERVRRIVRVCAQLAHKRLSPAFIDIIAEHIIATLPANLLRRLVRGDLGRPMAAAMHLTLPYMLPQRA